MKNLTARVANATLSILSSGTASRVARAMGMKTRPMRQPDMEPVDLGSPRAQAALKIVQCINHSHNKAQMATTARMIELYEQMYDKTLPLRQWWNSKNIDLTYYPPNA